MTSGHNLNKTNQNLTHNSQIEGNFSSRSPLSQHQEGYSNVGIGQGLNTSTPLQLEEDVAAQEQYERFANQVLESPYQESLFGSHPMNFDQYQSLTPSQPEPSQQPSPSEERKSLAQKTTQENEIFHHDQQHLLQKQLHQQYLPQMAQSQQRDQQPQYETSQDIGSSGMIKPSSGQQQQQFQSQLQQSSLQKAPAGGSSNSRTSSVASNIQPINQQDRNQPQQLQHHAPSAQSQAQEQAKQLQAEKVAASNAFMAASATVSGNPRQLQLELSLPSRSSAFSKFMREPKQEGRFKKYSQEDASAVAGSQFLMMDSQDDNADESSSVFSNQISENIKMMLLDAEKEEEKQGALRKRSQHNALNRMTFGLLRTFERCNPKYTYLQYMNPKRDLTQPSEGVLNNGYDNCENDYILRVSDVIITPEGKEYEIQDLMGKGTFGQVVKCESKEPKEMVAIKVIKNKKAFKNQGVIEIKILDIINRVFNLNAESPLVRMLDFFVFRDHLCIVFELLSDSIYDLLKTNNYNGVSLNFSRLIINQILEAMKVVKEAKLIHCDLKPENILFKQKENPSIKVIDFGSACWEGYAIFSYIQSRYYRSPEVLLGLPYDTAIDMWSLGCICAELFLGIPIFPGNSEYDQLARIIEILGPPPSNLIMKCKNRERYFIYDINRQSYRFKTLKEFELTTGSKVEPPKKYINMSSLDDLRTIFYEKKKLQQIQKAESEGKYVDRVSFIPSIQESELNTMDAFIDFLKGLLRIDKDIRWTPLMAMGHPFIMRQTFTEHYEPAREQERPLTNETGEDSMSERSSSSRDSKEYRVGSCPSKILYPQTASLPQYLQNPSTTFQPSNQNQAPAQFTSEPIGAASSIAQNEAEFVFHGANPHVQSHRPPILSIPDEFFKGFMFGRLDQILSMTREQLAQFIYEQNEIAFREQQQKIQMIQHQSMLQQQHHLLQMQSQQQQLLAQNVIYGPGPFQPPPLGMQLPQQQLGFPQSSGGPPQPLMQRFATNQAMPVNFAGGPQGFQGAFAPGQFNQSTLGPQSNFLEQTGPRSFGGHPPLPNQMFPVSQHQYGGGFQGGPPQQQFIQGTHQVMGFQQQQHPNIQSQQMLQQQQQMYQMNQYHQQQQQLIMMHQQQIQPSMGGQMNSQTMMPFEQIIFNPPPYLQQKQQLFLNPVQLNDPQYQNVIMQQQQRNSQQQFKKHRGGGAGGGHGGGGQHKEKAGSWHPPPGLQGHKYNMYYNQINNPGQIIGRNTGGDQQMQFIHQQQYGRGHHHHRDKGMMEGDGNGQLVPGSFTKNDFRQGIIEKKAGKYGVKKNSLTGVIEEEQHQSFKKSSNQFGQPLAGQFNQMMHPAQPAQMGPPQQVMHQYQHPQQQVPFPQNPSIFMNYAGDQKFAPHHHQKKSAENLHQLTLQQPQIAQQQQPIMAMPGEQQFYFKGGIPVAQSSMPVGGSHDPAQFQQMMLSGGSGGGGQFHMIPQQQKQFPSPKFSSNPTGTAPQGFSLGTKKLSGSGGGASGHKSQSSLTGINVGSGGLMNAASGTMLHQQQNQQKSSAKQLNQSQDQVANLSNSFSQSSLHSNTSGKYLQKFEQTAAQSKQNMMSTGGQGGASGGQEKKLFNQAHFYQYQKHMLGHSVSGVAGTGSINQANYRNRSNSDQVDEKELHNPKIHSSSQIYDMSSSREEDALDVSPEPGGGSGSKRTIALDALKGQSITVQQPPHSARGAYQSFNFDNPSQPNPLAFQPPQHPQQQIQIQIRQSQQPPKKLSYEQQVQQNQISAKISPFTPQSFKKSQPKEDKQGFKSQQQLQPQKVTKLPSSSITYSQQSQLLSQDLANLVLDAHDSPSMRKAGEFGIQSQQQHKQANIIIQKKLSQVSAPGGGGNNRNLTPIDETRLEETYQPGQLLTEEQQLHMQQKPKTQRFDMYNEDSSSQGGNDSYSRSHGGEDDNEDEDEDPMYT